MLPKKNITTILGLFLLFVITIIPTIVVSKKLGENFQNKEDISLKEDVSSSPLPAKNIIQATSPSPTIDVPTSPTSYIKSKDLPIATPTTRKIRQKDKEENDD